ncbi:hypothetical protein [Streptomyces sp. NPDC088736]|uniref:hypothetical protein n=1 Tax=Streptomyces sp. NPDC088736 TaxID=3365881 RepID=UPI003806C77D
MRGQTVCRSHGGSTPQARHAASRRSLEEQARDVVRGIGFEPIDNPLTALQALAGEMIAVKNFLRGQVERLEGIRYASSIGTEQLRGELAAYQSAMRDTAQVLGVIGRLRIDERLAAITEAQATLVIGAIDAALAHAGVTGTEAIEAKKVAARHLRTTGER